MITSDKVKRQLELEDESVSIGIKQYNRIKDIKMEKGEFTELPPGMRLMMRCIEPMIEAVKNFKLETQSTGHLKDTRNFLRQLSNEDIAFITANRLLNAVGMDEPIQYTAITLADRLIDQNEYLYFQHECPGYLYTIEKNMHTDNVKHRRKVIMRAKRKAGISDEQYPEILRLHIGVKCIDLFIKSTGVMERVQQKGRDLIKLRPVEEIDEWIINQHAKCELLNPMYLPMILPPKKWTTAFGGGFLLNEENVRQKLVRTRDNKALHDLNDREMPLVYRAINAAQETAWRINRRVYEVMKELWETGSTLGSLPDREKMPLPTKPWNTDAEFAELKVNDPDLVKSWKREATKVYLKREADKSKSRQMAQRMWIAQKFVDEEEIYFVWNMDWRGRMYPVQAYINPQANDAGKALIEFKNGVALGERGLYWLMVHMANCYGVDKVSFDDRVKWVKDHHEQIIDSAENPLDGIRFWSETNDHPFMFLAACFEYAEAVKQGASYVSHIPVGMDGTCNGLQMFAGLLRSEETAACVNVLPSEKPTDIYGIVAKHVAAKVKIDAEAGDPNAILWDGKIDRGIAKRETMTYVYGAKKYGFKGQLMEELKKRDDDLRKKSETYLGTNDNYAPAVYLAGKMYEGIGEVVTAAARAMDWLQEVAKIAAKSNQPLYWTTPVGFRPKQYYLKQELLSIRTVWGGVDVKLGLSRDTTELSTARQSNGISPNYIHSLDSAMLISTMNKCLDAGIKDFMMVHDSYGVHAAYIDQLGALLREAYIEQYTPNLLEKFSEEVKSQLPKELADEIPEVPAMGTLNLEEVRNSKYFFA